MATKKNQNNEQIKPNLQTVCFWCEAYRRKEKENAKPTTFARYIKAIVEMPENPNMCGVTMAYRIYGHKIVENKGLPLIQSDFVFIDNPLDGSLEQLAAAALYLDINDISSVIPLEEKMFDFLIEQQ